MLDNYKQLLKQLSNSYIQGYTSILIIKELLEVMESGRQIEERGFLKELYGMAYQIAVLNLSNLINYDKQSLNLTYLLSEYEKDIQSTFSHNLDKNIHEKLLQLRDLYPKHCKFQDGIMELRDKFIAHQDRARFNAQIRSIQKVSIDDMYLAYCRIGNLLDELDYDFEIYPEDLDLDNHELVINEFKRIIDVFLTMDSKNYFY